MQAEGGFAVLLHTCLSLFISGVPFARYGLPTIVKNLRELGGTDESRVVPRDSQLDPSAPSQMSLFDDQS